MNKRNRSTALGGAATYDPFGEPPAVRKQRIGAIRTARAAARLVRRHRRLEHWPTVGQLRSMAWLDGREPCSYLLDPRVNFVPELLAGYEGELGRHALCFTARMPHGVGEFVALSDGGGFDLF